MVTVTTTALASASITHSVAFLWQLLLCGLYNGCTIHITIIGWNVNCIFNTFSFYDLNNRTVVCFIVLTTHKFNRICFIKLIFYPLICCQSIFFSIFALQLTSHEPRARAQLKLQLNHNINDCISKNEFIQSEGCCWHNTHKAIIFIPTCCNWYLWTNKKSNLLLSTIKCRSFLLQVHSNGADEWVF